MSKSPIDDLGHPRGSGPGLPGKGGHPRLGWVALVGSFLVEILGMGAMGLAGGLAVGAWYASRAVALLPPKPVPPPPGPGFAPMGDRDLQVAGVWFGNLAVNGVIGLVVGLGIGVLLASFLLGLRTSRSARLTGR